MNKLHTYLGAIPKPFWLPTDSGQDHSIDMQYSLAYFRGQEGQPPQVYTLDSSVGVVCVEGSQSFPTQTLTHKIDTVNVFQFQSCLDLPLRGSWDPISDSPVKEAGEGHRVACWDLPTAMGASQHLSPVGGYGSLGSP